jgi:hypothetical protein
VKIKLASTFLADNLCAYLDIILAAFCSRWVEERWPAN